MGFFDKMHYNATVVVRKHVIVMMMKRATSFLCRYLCISVHLILLKYKFCICVCSCRVVIAKCYFLFIYVV